MNLQRLKELAGIGSNMNNPSQEPYSEIPGAAEDPTGSVAGTAGYDEVGDSGEHNPFEKIRDEAQRGCDNPEEAAECCRIILGLLDTENDDESGSEEPESESDLR